MTIRKKTLLIMSFTLAALTVALAVTSRIVLHSGFSRIEQEDTRRNAVRAANALQREVAAIDTKVHDWAAWDDTYEFIVDRNRRYFDSNLVRDSFNTLGINYIIYIDSAGTIVYAKGYDLKESRQIPVPDSLLRLISRRDKLSLHADPHSFSAGVLNLPEGVLILSSRPITRTDETGPVRGALVFARLLDDVEIRRIADTTRLAVDIRPVGDPSAPPDYHRVAPHLTHSGSTAVLPLSDKMIAGYSVVPDIYGEPALIARATMPRDVFDQERRSIWYLLASVLVAGIMFTGAVIYLLERSILSRLAGLSGDFAAIGHEGDFSARLVVSGGDELAEVASSGNRMLDAHEKSLNRITHRNREMRTIMDGVPIGLLSLDRGYRVNPEYSRSAEDIFGITGLAGRGYFEILGFPAGESPERDILREYLELLFNESFPAEDLARLNPFEEMEIRRADGGGVWVRTQYLLMHRGVESTSSILVVLENITAGKELTEQVAKSEAEAVHLMNIFENPDLYREFLSAAEGIVERMEATVSSAAADRIDSLLRDAHTLKGTSSAFGAAGMSGLADELETVLQRIRTLGSRTDGEIEEIGEMIRRIHADFETIRSRAEKILGEEAIDSRDIMLRIPLSKVKSVQEEVRKIHDIERLEILDRLRILRTVPAKKGFARALKIAEDLLHRTMKPAEVRIEGGEEPVDCEVARELNVPLIHLFRNAIGHGIEESEERESAGKPLPGLITLSIGYRNGSLVIGLSDDGRGIDHEIIRKAAVGKKFLSPEEAALLTPRECTELIFRPGFSTAARMDFVMGRGVGMNAVLAAVSGLGGTVEVETEPLAGSRFIITVPVSDNG